MAQGNTSRASASSGEDTNPSTVDVLARPASVPGRSASVAPNPPDDLSETADLDPRLLDLIDQITSQLDAGEAVDEEQLAAAHPTWANEIRGLVPALRGMAQAGAIIARDHDPTSLDPKGPAGRQVGEFRLIREIGRGGMGIVYEAIQDPLGRRVALKLLPTAAALDPRAVQRFELEAQVAGLLQHPRIVTVHAVGLFDEIPFFAMQLIDGASLANLITELRDLVDRGSSLTGNATSLDTPSSLAIELINGRFAETAHVAGVNSSRDQPQSASIADKPDPNPPETIRGPAYIRTIARLGIQAAEALGYAHDQGIIHRDIKPANLLLDKRGDLWVADFGMANVQGDAGMTLTGDLPGTLRFMSPEQATGQRALVDRRTDIYSLGVTLYELLTLQPAVTGPDKAAIIRRIADDEPPPIRRLNPAVPVDLATIITKAFSKDPANRYETALKFADDLDRFLDSRPIAARPTSALSRSWRWCLRKPVQAGLATSLVVALVVGFAGITWNWRDALRQRQEALVQKQEAVRQKQEAQRQEQEAIRQKALLVVSQRQAEASEKKALTHAAKADAINDFLIEKLLRQAAPEHSPVAKKVTLQEVLDRAAAGVGTSFKDQPLVEAAIRLTLGQTYHDLGDYAKSAKHYRASYLIHQKHPDETSERKLKAMTGLGHSLAHQGHLNDAELLLVDAVDDAARLFGPKHDVCLTARGYLADLRTQQRRDDDAEAINRSLVDDYRRTRGPKDPSTVSAINNLGYVLQRQKKYTDAETLFRECLTINREISGPDDPGTILAVYNLGFVLNEMGRSVEAEKLLHESLDSARQVLGPEHPTTLQMMNTLGLRLSKTGRLDDAEKLLRPCLEARKRVLGPNHHDTEHTAALLDALIKKRFPPTRSKAATEPNSPKP
jgi:serine/threonine protein kinase